MGRQFRYYCMPDDLIRIEEQVFRPLRGRLFRRENTSGTDRIVPVAGFALGLEQMGNESLGLLLLPPSPMEHLILDGGRLDTFSSNVIEVGLCYIDGKIIRHARFWYEARTFLQNQFGSKSPEFVKWAGQVFSATKRLMTCEVVLQKGEKSRSTYKDWFGSRAWEEVSSGRLHAELN